MVGTIGRKESLDDRLYLLLDNTALDAAVRRYIDGLKEAEE